MCQAVEDDTCKCRKTLLPQDNKSNSRARKQAFNKQSPAINKQTFRDTNRIKK